MKECNDFFINEKKEKEDMIRNMVALMAVKKHNCTSVITNFGC